MSALLAIFHRNGTPVQSDIVQKMLGAANIAAPDGTDVWNNAHIVLAHRHFWITPEEQGERQPLCDPSGTLVLAFDGRIDNRPELIDQLFDERTAARSYSDAAIVLQSYRRWGSDCAKHLLGDFAFVVWDAANHHLYAARDALGGRQLCYYLDSHCAIFCTEIAPILAHPNARKQLNEFKVASFLNSFYDDQEETFYEGIHYLAPAHCITVETETTTKRQYWRFDPESTIRYHDERDYAEHFRTLLDQAVVCRLRSDRPIGVAMSGGLDSTSVAGVAAERLREQGNAHRLKTFSYVFDELTSCDERQYILPMVRRHQLDATFLPGDDRWPLSNFEIWPSYHDHPAQDSFVWLTLDVTRAASEAGCRLVLTGQFGDMLFGGASFWSLDMVRDLRLLTLARTMVEISDSAPAIQAARLMLPYSLKRAYRAIRPHQYALQHPGINPDLLRRTGFATRALQPQEFDVYSRPGQWLRLRALTNAAMSEGSALLNQLGSQYSILYENPFYDRRLLEFAMAVPAYVLGRPRNTKRLLRSAMTCTLPVEIAQRRGKTSLVPLLQKGLVQEAASTVRRIFSNPRITQHRFVRTEWLQSELEQGQWAKNGYLIWLCIGLELWLNRYWHDA